MDEHTISPMTAPGLSSMSSGERTKLLDKSSLNPNQIENKRLSKKSEICHCFLFVFIIIIVLGCLIGLFFLVKLTTGESKENCQLIRVDNQSGSFLVMNNNPSISLRASRTISTLIKSASGIIGNKGSDEWGSGQSKNTSKPSKHWKHPQYSQLIKSVSSDNMVKLDFQGYVVIDDIQNRYEFVSTLGGEAILTHHLNSNIPTIEINFMCGRIVFYVNKYLDTKSTTRFATIMLTGETTSGIIFGPREFFKWRTPILEPPLFTTDVDKYHYFCDVKQDIPLIVNQEENFQMRLVLEYLELEIFRHRVDKGKFLTPRGIKCDQKQATKFSTGNTTKLSNLRKF